MSGSRLTWSRYLIALLATGAVLNGASQAAAQGGQTPAKPAAPKGAAVPPKAAAPVKAPTTVKPESLPASQSKPVPPKISAEEAQFNEAVAAFENETKRYILTCGRYSFFYHPRVEKEQREGTLARLVQAERFEPFLGSQPLGEDDLKNGVEFKGWAHYYAPVYRRSVSGKMVADTWTRGDGPLTRSQSISPFVDELKTTGNYFRTRMTKKRGQWNFEWFYSRPLEKSPAGTSYLDPLEDMTGVSCKDIEDQYGSEAMAGQ